MRKGARANQATSVFERATGDRISVQKVLSEQPAGALDERVQFEPLTHAGEAANGNADEDLTGRRSVVETLSKPRVQRFADDVDYSLAKTRAPQHGSVGGGGAIFSRQPSMPSMLRGGTMRRLRQTGKSAHHERERRRPSACLIDPRASRWLGTFDVLSVLALAFTALVTPWEVAFLSTSGVIDWLFVVNRIVDSIFLLDILIQFNLMYPSGSDGKGHRYVDDHAAIAKKYLCSWFFIDAFSTGLSLVDLLPFVQPDSVSDATCSGDGALPQLKVLRTIRVLRLTKLLRLVRASRLLARWETKVAVNYAALALLRITLAVLLYLHWSACLWAVQVRLLHPTTTCHILLHPTALPRLYMVCRACAPNRPQAIHTAPPRGPTFAIAHPLATLRPYLRPGATHACTQTSKQGMHMHVTHST